MANHVTETESAPVGTLVKDIVQDLEKLGQQHLKLFKQDLREDFRRLRVGSLLLGAAVGILLIGGLLLGMTLAELLVLAGMDQWAAYGLVAIVILATGGGLLAAGLTKIDKAMPLADQTLETLQEDVQWAKHPK